ARAQDRGRRPWQWALHIRSEGAASSRAGARVARTAAIAAADIEDAGRTRSPHWRGEAIHRDCSAEDASRRIGTRRGPLPGGALKSRRMPIPDSPVAVDALRSSEARATAGVYGQRLHDGL